MRLKNQVAIVTGAGGGLGYVFAKTLLDEGAIVVMTDISEEYLDSAFERLGDLRTQTRVKIMDVSSIESVSKIMNEIYSEFNRIDILVNNAGGGLHTPKELEKIEEKHWDLILDVNLKGTFFCCQEAVKYMKMNSYGRIINISSIGSKTASIVSNVAYASAKGGVNALTRRLALEVGKFGINVNAIAPGTVLSGQRMIDVWDELSDLQKQNILDSIPLGRLSTAEEQADVLLFLADEASRYITGSVIDVNGGRFMS